MTNKVYSRDDEWFQYDELHALIQDHELVAGDVIFAGESKKLDTKVLFDADDLVDMIADRAYDNIGEASEGFGFLTKEDRAELDRELAVLIDKYFPQNFYQVVNVQEYTITEEDVNE